MSSTNCWNLRVSAEVNQGGRKYMEDVTHVQFERAVYYDCQKRAKKVVEYASFAIFDGHGGKEAAHFARDNILENIKKQKNFFSKDAETVKRAIRDGFIATHQQMWNELPNWPKTTNGHPSTAGTTASLVLIRGNRMYVANVGDSMVVMGTRDHCFRNNSRGFQAMELTVDHKPELPEEKKRIEHCGGCVMNKAGVNRVVWNRPKLSHNGPIRRSTKLDRIPFLAIARSLGDLWSFNSELNEFIVSPIPDVNTYDLNHDREQFIILASDGLWNMVRPYETVTAAGTFEERKQKNLINGTPAHELVKRALERWNLRGMRADNTSVIVVFIDRKKMESTSKNRGAYAESWTSAKLESVNIEPVEVKKEKDVNDTLVQSGSSSSITEESFKAKDPLQDSSISSSSGDIPGSKPEQCYIEPGAVGEDKYQAFPTAIASDYIDQNSNQSDSEEITSTLEIEKKQIRNKRITRRMSKGLGMLFQEETRSKYPVLNEDSGNKGHKRKISEEIQNTSKIYKNDVSGNRKKFFVQSKVTTRSTSNNLKTYHYSLGQTTRIRYQRNSNIWQKKKLPILRRSKR